MVNTPAEPIHLSEINVGLYPSRSRTVGDLVPEGKWNDAWMRFNDPQRGAEKFESESLYPDEASLRTLCLFMVFLIVPLGGLKPSKCRITNIQMISTFRNTEITKSMSYIEAVTREESVTLKNRGSFQA